MTISLLGEVEQGRTPAWAGAAPLFWRPSGGRGPFRGGGHSWRLRALRPDVLASRGRLLVSLLGTRSSLPKLSDLLCSWSEEPRCRGAMQRDTVSLPPRLACLPWAPCCLWLNDKGGAPPKVQARTSPRRAWCMPRTFWNSLEVPWHLKTK